MDLYFQRYPGVQRYIQYIRTQAADQGYVETWFGRRLYLPEIKSSNFQMRQAAERTAINAPMQGTAADIIKRAMIDVQDWLNTSNAPASIIMQVHDELVLEVDDAALEETQAAIIRLMCVHCGLQGSLLLGIEEVGGYRTQLRGDHTEQVGDNVQRGGLTGCREPKCRICRCGPSLEQPLNFGCFTRCAGMHGPL